MAQAGAELRKVLLHFLISQSHLSKGGKTKAGGGTSYQITIYATVVNYND